MKKNTKSALLLSVVSIILCCTMLLGTTMAWFTDSVTSSVNKIVAGNLDIALYTAEPNLEGMLTGNPVTETDISDSTEPLFNYELWEPGYTAVRNLKLANEGTLALKWKATIVPTSEVGVLAEVIDVYLLKGEIINTANGRDSYESDLTHVGTLKDIMENTTAIYEGELLAEGNESVEYFAIVLKMQESAGNEYQGKEAGTFDIQIVATQFTYEEDSFNNQYDADAEYPTIISVPADAEAVKTLEDLQNALTTGGNYYLDAPITVNASLTVSEDIAIYGNNETLTFTDNSKITVSADKALEIYDTTLDANGEYSFDADGNIVYDADARRTTPLLNASAGSTLTLGQGTVVQNVVAKGSAVINSNGTDDNRATVILEGATIKDCAGESGTIINVNHASDVYIEEGTVISNNASYNNNNHGIIRVYNAWDAANPSTVTINGGEINNNYYSGNGMIGLYYGKLIMNGGTINGNAWFEDNQINNGWYPVVYVHSNSQFVMNGGTISGNTVKYGVINSLNSAVEGALTINGGTITNNIATNNDNKDAFAVVINKARNSLVVSENANTTGTVWVYYDEAGEYLGEYYTLEDFLGN